MTKQKVLAVSAVLGIAALVLSAGTLAYFTDKTDAVTNVFTIGKVHITLTEPEADNWGVDANGVAKTVMMPGGSYKKTPTITVADDSQSAWVFAKIEVGNKQDFIDASGGTITEAMINQMTEDELEALLANYIVGYKASRWSVVDVDLSGQNAVFTIMYYKAMTAGSSVKIFTAVKMPSELTEDNFADGSFSNGTIKITAYAIQSTGIKKANAYSIADAAGLFATGPTGSGESMTEEDGDL